MTEPVGSGVSAEVPRTSLRLDWVLAPLSVWLVGGFYIDLWAHSHGRVDNTFFTPWHALLYTGAASFAVFLGAVAIFGTPRRVAVRNALPGPSIHLWLGAIVIAGVIGLFIDELGHGPTGPTGPTSPVAGSMER